LATVRIYKVAELLGTSSQEVMALLKRDHGIEVKSASSTIEEVVGRQFVERLARQRGIALPSGDMFSDRPAPGRKPALARKAEPPKPQVQTLGPPRLVKAPRPPAPPPSEAPEAPSLEAFEAAFETAEAPPEDVTEAPEPAAEAAAAEGAPAAEEASQPAAEAADTPTPAPPPAGRVVPPTIRLRIEEQRPEPGSPEARPLPRPVTPSRPVQPRQPAPRPAPPRPAAAPPRPASQPSMAARPGARPGEVRPYQPPVPPGGPRPLPSHPIRPSQPGMPARPAVGPRPPMRPPMRGRPGGHRRDGDRRPDSRPAAAAAPAAPPPITRSITAAEGMTVKDLADKLEVRAKDVLKKLLDKRLMMTINSTLDSETASLIAREFGADVQMRSFEEELLQVESEDYDAADLAMRAPVVTVMGHVDHGKTTLLDAIRSTRVAEREAGGITQHIGAYHVTVGERSIVFLDTPGHEAFTMMRARGAKVTDVVVLVVAADDGVMPQTKEAINHARAANVPIIVAVNKIDKPGANPDQVKRELADLGLVPEAWGGSTVMVDVSAKKREGLDLLLEMVLLVTDIGELKANPKRNASGTVLEAKLDRGRGPVATILVQDGTLSVGDTFIAGTIVGKVRALIDDRGRPTKSAGPSTPVEVLGLTGLPSPGDAFQAVADAAKARQIAHFRQEQAKARTLGARTGRVTLESLQQQIAEGSVKELAIIIKADVQGSAEVLADSLTKLSTDRVKIKILHSGVGAINEFDVLLASASEAIIVGFNVRPDRSAAEVAERENVDIRLHSVIYNVSDEIKKAMVGLLEPTVKETRLGAAAVRELFKVPKAGVIAGCMVTDGRITRGGDAQARLLRDNVVIHEGRIASLRRFKDDVSEVKAGLECGIAFDRYHDIKVGDVIECFVVERVAATV